MEVAVPISAKKRISCGDDSENEAPENSRSTSAPSPSVKAARVSLGNVTSGQKQPLADGCPNVVPAAAPTSEKNLSCEANVVFASTENCSHSIAGKSAEITLSNKNEHLKNPSKSPGPKKSGLNFRFKGTLSGSTKSTVSSSGTSCSLAISSVKNTDIFNPEAKVAAPPVVPPPAPPCKKTAGATLAAKSTVTIKTTKRQVKSSGYGKSDPRHPKPKIGAPVPSTSASSSSSSSSLLLSSSSSLTSTVKRGRSALASSSTSSSAMTPPRATRSCTSKSPLRSSSKVSGASGSTVLRSASKEKRLTPWKSSSSGSCTGVSGARVQIRGEALLKAATDRLDDLLTQRVKGKKFEYKERAEAAVRLVTEFRGAVKDMREQQRQFVNDAASIEEALLLACEAANRSLADSTSEAEELRVNYQVGEREKNSLMSELKTVKDAKESLVEANNVTKAQLYDKTKSLKEAEERVSAMDRDLTDAIHTAEQLKLQKNAVEELATAAAAAHADTLEAETTRLDEEYKQQVEALTAEVLAWTAKAEESGKELTELQQQANSDATELTAAQEKVKQLARSLEESTADKASVTKAKEILEIQLSSSKEQLSAKANELTMALGSLGEIQRTHADREAVLRSDTAAAEKKAIERAAEAESLKAALSVAQRDAEISSQELVGCRSQIGRLESDLASSKVTAESNMGELNKLGEALAVERAKRERAETREEEERRERTASCAQLIAQTQANDAKLEALRIEAKADAEKAATALEKLRSELETTRTGTRNVEDQRQSLESEARQLRALLEDEKKNGAELVEMAKRTGELDAMKQRMQEQATRSDSTLAEAHQRIKELEAEVQAGESLRRKMHNTIQELRGNVRVFARVRPFLPGDGEKYLTGGGGGLLSTSSSNAPPPTIKCAGGIESTKLVVDKPSSVSEGAPSTSYSGAESHSFVFDKCFAPSVSQENVFQEVSEFVTSALDGYQVCLFSYGQTGSGKTHTMQGSGDSAMRGIIPRAIEQVGKYKTALEAQGWTYKMEVTFVEIYNETIRDLLRSSDKKASEPQLEIRTGKDGSTYVSDATKMAVDPTDLACISNIMEIAARHRAVSATDMNAQSSRSHSIFTLHLRGMNESTRTTITGALNLVDLAGSERLSRSGATGDRLKETQAINKSLACLSDVFMAISNRQSHIPFRNSKLTHLLSPSLSGDGKTLMLVNLSPTEESYFESLCSLRFARTVNKCELGKPKKNTGTVPSGSGNANSKKIRK